MKKVILIVLSVACIVALVSFTLFAPDLINNKKYGDIAKEFLLDNLKAPSTATIKIKCIVDSDDGVLVYGYFDAQNSFGAFGRSKYGLIINPNNEQVDIYVIDDTLYTESGESKLGDRLPIVTAEESVDKYIEDNPWEFFDLDKESFKAGLLKKEDYLSSVEKSNSLARDINDSRDKSENILTRHLGKCPNGDR